ncbi:hypothetical protein chiPu_0019901, partial [Chiloscyllium punctatum]|nr:hypothetical protein [Chiloscyllium punctatum]
MSTAAKLVLICLIWGALPQARCWLNWFGAKKPTTPVPTITTRQVTSTPEGRPPRTQHGADITGTALITHEQWVGKPEGEAVTTRLRDAHMGPEGSNPVTGALNATEGAWDGPSNSTVQPGTPLAASTLAAGEASRTVTPAPALTEVGTPPGPTATGGGQTERLVTVAGPVGRALTTEEASSLVSSSSEPSSPSLNASLSYTTSPSALATPHRPDSDSVNVTTAAPSSKPSCGPRCPGSALGTAAQPANRRSANLTGDGSPEGGQFGSGTASRFREDGWEATAGDGLAAAGGSPWTDHRVHEASRSSPLRAGSLISQLSHDAVGGGHKMVAGKGGNRSDGQSPLSAPSASDHSKHDGIVLDNSSRAIMLVFNQNVTNGVLGALAATAAAAAAADLGAKLDLLTSTKASDPDFREAVPGSGAPLPPDCAPLPPSLRFCRPRGHGGVRLPNHLRQASMAEIQEAAQSWGALLASGCHPGLVPFLCRLLAPRCGPPRQREAPCRGHCEAVRDHCWMELAGSGLQLPCHLLPDAEEGRGCQSLMVGRG